MFLYTLLIRVNIVGDHIKGLCDQTRLKSIRYVKANKK
jgi:hypothetical protein